MTVAHFFAVFRARWLAALVALALTMLAFGAWTFSRVRQYTATASVLIDAKSPDPISGVVLQGVAAPNFMITQVDIIQSLRVARQVVRSLELERDARWRAIWKQSGSTADFESWAAQSIAKHLDVRPSRGSNVINLSYTDPNPEAAAAFVNGFVRSYLATTVDLRVAPAREHSDFFDERAKSLRQATESARAKLAAFQQDHGLLATDERLDSENMRLNDLTQQVVALEASAAESKSRQGQAQATPGRMQEVLNDPVVFRLAADLARQESRYEELASRLGPSNPQMTELQGNINALREKLSEARNSASGSVTVTNSVTQVRLAQARAARDAQREKLLQLKSQRNEAMGLQRDVDTAQRSYESVQARLDQTGLEIQTAPSNIAALEYATAPDRPSSMGPLRILAYGLLTGLLLASVTVLVREWRDRRLRTHEEFPRLVNLQLIGVVPSFAVKSRSKPLMFGRRRVLSLGA